MGNINSVNISGNITRDPELRQTAGGMCVLTFGIASNDRRKNQQTGEWEDHPNFVDCTVFGKRAEGLARFLAKGMKVALSGSLRYSSWEKDGQKRSKLEVVADEVEVMSQAQQQPQAAPAYGQGYAPQPMQPMQQQYAPQPMPAQQYAPQAAPQQPQAAAVQSVYDEDIPF